MKSSLCLEAAHSAVSPTDIAVQQNIYFGSIQEARNRSHEHDMTANRVMSGMRWYQFWKWPSVWWNRMRAGDYNAVARGIENKNMAWEGLIGATQWGVRIPTDAFITVPSQIGDPAVPPGRRFRLNSDGNGNNTHKLAPLNYGNNYDQIEAAMRSVGAQ